MKLYSFMVHLVVVLMALRGGEGGCGVDPVDKVSEYNYINATVNGGALYSGDAVFYKSSFEWIGVMSDNITTIKVRLKYEDVTDNDTIRFSAGNADNFILITTRYAGNLKIFDSSIGSNHVTGFITLGSVDNIPPKQYDFTGVFKVGIRTGSDSITVTDGTLKAYHYEYTEEDGWSCQSSSD